jgi:hypothetical protein
MSEKSNKFTFNIGNVNNLAAGDNVTQYNLGSSSETVARPQEIGKKPNSKPSANETTPLVFISYSRKDEQEKDQLLAHLGVLEEANLIESWSDDQIGPGADWEMEISRAITTAKVAVLLITANFLTSKFVRQKEIPEILKRRDQEGLNIIPIISKACAWKTVDWLARMNVRPKNGRPIWGHSASDVDGNLAAIAEEIADIVGWQA